MFIFSSSTSDAHVSHPAEVAPILCPPTPRRPVPPTAGDRNSPHIMAEGCPRALRGSSTSAFGGHPAQTPAGSALSSCTTAEGREAWQHGWARMDWDGPALYKIRSWRAGEKWADLMLG